MSRQIVAIVSLLVLLVLTGCQVGSQPATLGGSPATQPPESSDAVGVAEPATAPSTSLPPSPAASLTSTPTATPSAGPLATGTLPATVRSSPTVTGAPARATLPTATPSPLAVIPPGLVVNSECGDQGGLRLSRVYWGEQSPPISAPGSTWVAQTMNPDGDARLVVARAGGADPVVVSAPDEGLPLGMPFWSPAEGAEGDVPRLAVANVALSQPGGGSIYVLDAGGVGLVHVADYLGYHDDLAWSPDGAWIAYTSAATVSGSGSGMQVRDYQVLVAPANGSGEPVIAGPGCSPHWQLDGPQIVAFQVTPAHAMPGDTVSLAWQAQGDSATLCPTARYTLFTQDDCWQAPVSGFTTFLLPTGTEGFQYVDLVLKVETTDSPDSAIAQASVALECERTWFYSDAPQAGICPLEPVHTEAAAQHFERGLMIWLREPGRYYILDYAPAVEGALQKRVDVISDPLEIIGDTSAQFEPPPGLHAPESGFGLVWRGDVAQSPGYRDRLGWALEPEFGYEAILQCDDARPSGGRSWQTCYLQGPDDEVILLHPLGSWALLGD